MEDIRRVAVVGLGAMGAIYAQCIVQNAPEVQVAAMVRDRQSYLDHPVTINGRPLAVEYVDDYLPRPADLVIVAVKNHHLPQVIKQMEDFVGSGTLILSLLNGIDSEEQLARAYGWERVLFSVVVGIDANRENRAVRLNKLGEIHFGRKQNRQLSEDVLRVKALFDKAKIPYQIPEDMEKCLWWKLLINIGMNQVSTVKQLTYGEFRNDPEAMALMTEAQREVIAVARRLGVDLGEADIARWQRQLTTLTPNGRSSMLQDYWSGRKTEVDAMGDKICALGRQLGIPTPVNRQLSQQIHAMDKANGF